MSALTVLGMSALLGAASFGVGVLPLSASFSKQYLARLSRLGTGLLLGTSLGVIIPEGVEALAAANKSAEAPTRTIALSLLAGFAVMLLVEQLGPAHAEHAPQLPHTPFVPGTPGTGRRSFDVELAELEGEQSVSSAAGSDAARPAYPLTVGLVIHGLADGLALGVSALSEGETDLSLIVFLALAIHKAPTALAFTLAHLAAGTPRPTARTHLLLFSLSTPAGAVLAYTLFAALGLRDPSRVGAALLVSGGSFLYVATVLQPVAHGHGQGEGDGSKSEGRLGLGLLLAGFITPFLLSSLLEHGHH
ncbi:Zinc/iron permease [Vararia minispora EC-137]|uniref:Zinc/iron permease n=1 Tax=Vararia minispora EC-137 TaxID=1314806 RepID=A0ACB8QXF1_9AGAM|nr:Zinc/iron permease [Vararia minispora EC-137]